MTKMLFAALTAATLLATPAFAGENETVFTRDGQTYAYTIAANGDATVIQGRTLPQNDPFRLVVRGRTASGKVDGRPVSFRIARPLVAVADTGTTGATLAAN